MRNASLTEQMEEMYVALLNIMGGVRVSRLTVNGVMNQCTLESDPKDSAEKLSAAEGALVLTEEALGRLIYRFATAQREIDAMTPVEEVCNG